MTNIDNRVQLQDCEDNGEVSDDTTAAPTAAVSDAGAVIQGTNSIAFQVDDEQELILFDRDSAAVLINVDMSDVTVYMNVKHNLGESFANLGGQICLGDGLETTPGDVIGYNVNGNDVAGFPYLFRFTSIKLDVSVIVATPGSNDVDYFQYFGTEAGLNHASILQIGYGSFNVEKAISTGKNAWIDGIYYIANTVSATTGFAVSIEGGTVGTPETMVDVFGDDVAVGMGLFNNPKGSEFGFFGPTEWGDAAADTYLTSEDQQWYFIGDNQGGAFIGAGHFPFRLIGDSASTNSFVIQRITIVATGTRASFDLSNADMDFVQLTSVAFIGLGPLTFPTQDVDKFCNSGTFSDCDQMDLQSLDMDGCTWNGSTDANGFFIWDENDTDPANQDNSTLVSDGTGNAIEVAPTGTGPFTYNVEGLTVDGFATQAGTDTDRVFFINPADLSADITINLTNALALNAVGGGSEAFSHRDVGSYAGTLTINTTVTITVQVDDSAGDPVSNARVRVERVSDGSLVVEGSTDSTGEFTDSSFNFSSDLDVLTKVRLKGFKPFRTGGTIVSTGLTVGVTFQTDSIVDLP